jgi:5'-3' exonuclease
MGIKNLNKLLNKHCPTVFKQIHISEYRYKKIAIDISLYIYKYKAVCGDRWIQSMINLISCLRKNDIHIVFIFDNGSPKEKKVEIQERKERHENTEKRIGELEDALDMYYKTGEIDTILFELYEKIKPANNHLLSTKNKPKIDIKIVEDKINKMKNYIINICENDFLLVKELCDILKIPYYLAPLEAECMCSYMVKEGIIDAVLTEDTDVLAYKATNFLSKIDTTNETCVQVNYHELLSLIKLNSNEFLDLCILCGTDFNK